MSRRSEDRPVRWVAHAFATIVALAVTATIVALSLGILAVRFVGLNAYVVQGGPTESTVPVGSLVLIAPTSTERVAAIPTLGYAVSYAETYSPPIVIGLIVWILFVLAVRALAPYMSTARRRLPA